MAHTNRPRRRTGLAVAALLFAHAALAAETTLGDIDVRSRPGEPLDAVIAIGESAAGSVTAPCIFVSRGAPEEGPFVTRASVAVYDEAGGRYVRLKSADPVGESARLRVVVRCPGTPHVAYREYRGLFEPQPAPATPVPPLAVAGTIVPAPVPPAAGEFPIIPGDTLESIASAIFPKNRGAQRNYIEALRERNPAIQGIGAREPLPVDVTIELPDLRAAAKARPSTEPATQAAVTPDAPPKKAAAPRAPAPKAEPKAEPKGDAVAAAPAPKPAAPAKPAPKAVPAPAEPKAARAETKAPSRAASRAQPGGEFALRLSGSEIDMTRSRGVDDRARARLRERQLLLDNDDQVAALLSLRDSLKRLEGRVAELQLKLSGMPANMPSAPPKVEPPKIEPPKIEPPKIDPPKAEPPPAPVAKVEPPAPKVEVAPPPVKAEAPKPAKPAAATRAPSRPAPEEEGGLSQWLWAVVALLVVLAGWLAWRIFRRRGEAEEELLPEIAEIEPLEPTTTLAEAEPAAAASDMSHLDIDVNEPVAVAVPAAPRREMDSDAALATEVRGADPAALRRRYIEERFPEIGNRTIVLGDPDSVVKAARLFYEDGAISRAVELLQFATEETPAEPKPWLALFEIFRLERLSGQFADLAQRFKEAHGQSENWRKVQYFGREIDPGNALYRDLAVGIETIKFEVGKPPPAVSFDPVAENWLNAPMDFENEVLVVELRRALMNEAGLVEQDLVPNPMPALRSVEMFTVA